MRRLLLLCSLALSGSAVPVRVWAQIPALSTVLELDSSLVRPLQDRLKVLTDSAQLPRVHEQMDAKLDSIFAANCGGLFDKLSDVFTRRRGECFWGKHEISALNLGNITATGNTGSLYSDLTTTYFGPLRLSLSALISASGQEEGNTAPEQDARAAFQRLIAGGGNLIASIQAPLLHYRATRVNGLRFTTALLARGAADVSSLGADSAQSQARSFASAIDMRLQLNSNDATVAMFAYGKGEFVRGSDAVPAFLSSATNSEARHLYYGQASIGARLLNAVVVTYTFYGCAQCRRAGVSDQISITAQKSGF